LQETVEIGGRGRDRMSAFSILEEDVYDSVFAQFFDVKPPTAEWPKAPLDLEDVYEHVILKSYKEEQDVARYRQAFGKRILQEGLLAEMKGRKPDVGGREEKTAAFEIFIKEERPQLLWELEKQVYELGDQQGAALGMLQHLGKFAGQFVEDAEASFFHNVGDEFESILLAIIGVWDFAIGKSGTERHEGADFIAVFLIAR